MVMSGMDWQTIADRLYDGSISFACTDYKRAKDASRAQLNTTVEEARWLEVDRLDRLQAAVWPKALNGDTKAADTAHRLIISRCKILGLEAPTQIMLNARMELESTIVSEVIIAVIDSLGLDPSQRVAAFNIAQERLALAAGSEDDLDSV